MKRIGRSLHLAAVTVSVTLTLAGAVVMALAVARDLSELGPFSAAGLALEPIYLVNIAAVTLLLNLRRPENRVGWLFALQGPMLAFIMGVWSYQWPTLPGFDVPYVWLTQAASFYVIALSAPALALIFPDGRLPSARWRRPVVAVTAVFAVSCLALGLVPGQLAALVPPQSADAIRIRLALEGWGIGALTPFGEVLTLLAFGGLVLLIAMGVAAVVVRRRSANAVVRAQLRWFLVAATLVLVGFVVTVGQSMLNPEADVSAGLLVAFSGLALFPVAVGVAVLRYRLYDIDLIIRRTLVYGALSVLLGGVYVGSVLGLQTVLAPITQGDGLAVAVSTLTVAALFRPVRRRVQREVDRRFYRSGYDARSTLAAFGARLRDEVDLDRLTDEVAQVATLTMHPSAVSVWIRRP